MSFLDDLFDDLTMEILADDGCDWCCDDCEALLNEQSGFTVTDGVWECEKCGCINDVTEDNITNW